MRTTTLRRTALAALLAAPLVLAAQGPARGGRMMRPMDGPDGPPPRREAGVTQILNARRILDLTPRQVAQLDSIERTVFAERRTAETRMRALRDSIRTQVEQQGAPANDAERTQRREAVRTRLESMRPQMMQMRGKDSTANAAARRVLTDAQRQQLREIEAEQRGRQRGLREAQVRERRMIEPRMGNRRIGPGAPEGTGEVRRRRMIEAEQRDRSVAPRRPDTDG